MGKAPLRQLIEYSEFSLEEIKNIGTLKLQLDIPWLNSLSSMSIYSIKDDMYISYNYEIKLLIREVSDLYQYYVRLFSLLDLWREKNIVFKITNLKIKNWENLNTDRLDKNFSVVFKIINSNNFLGDVCENHLNLLKRFHFEVKSSLTSNTSSNSVKTFFDFPEKVKFYCEQYLLYFAQFLQDLGINATSNLKEEAGKVLFSVTPTDDVEALDKIREALAVYLNLPASPISDLEYSENFALMRLQQQVRNLQHSQQMAKTELLSAQYALGLAQNNIENQDQIIVRQHSTIENLNKVIEKITSNSIMTDSLDKKDKEEFEEICEGLRVGESKWLRELTGVGLSTGKFVKAIVKNTFGKEEQNSILGLDEE